MSGNDILHADGGVFLHHAALTGFLTAGLDVHSRLPGSVITRDKIKWLRANITDFTASEQILILSFLINCTLTLSQSLLRVT